LQKTVNTRLVVISASTVASIEMAISRKQNSYATQKEYASLVSVLQLDTPSKQQIMGQEAASMKTDECKEERK
jgi:hypothetical protein